MSESFAARLGMPRAAAWTALVWSAVAELATGMLALTAALVAWRQLAGAIEHPTQPAGLLLAGGLAIGLAGAARFARRQAGAPGPLGIRPAEPWPARVLTSVAVLLLAGGVSLRGGSLAPLCVFWAAILAEEGWAWARVLRRRRFAAANLTETPRTQSEGFSPPSVFHPPPSALPDEVLQQLTLSRDAQGRRLLAGWLRLVVEAGQRSGNLHVAFCPPFAEPPEVEAESLAGPPCSIKTAQVLPYGARLELKLTATADHPDSVVVRFTARDAKTT